MTAAAVPDSPPLLRNGRLPLAAWMAERALRDADVARTLSVHRSTVSRIRRGRQRPDPALAAMLRELTAGIVDFADGEFTGGDDPDGDLAAEATPRCGGERPSSIQPEPATAAPTMVSPLGR